MFKEKNTFPHPFAIKIENMKKAHKKNLNTQTEFVAKNTDK